MKRRFDRVVALRTPRDQTPSLSDESVAVACSTGDPAAVAELFNRHHADVARYLSRLVRPRADVEDLVQATFLEVARSVARFEGRSSVRTWLFGIATNVLRHHRRSGARRFRLLEAAERERPSPRAEATHAVSEARELLARVQKALDRLSPERRFAFVLCEIEGLSAREAAAALDTSEQAVWRRVSDARRVLRAVAEQARLAGNGEASR